MERSSARNVADTEGPLHSGAVNITASLHGMWRGVRNSGDNSNANESYNRSHQDEAVNTWKQNPSLYELSPGMDLETMTKSDWRKYSINIFDPWADVGLGAAYAADPESWGGLPEHIRTRRKRSAKPGHDDVERGRKPDEQKGSDSVDPSRNLPPVYLLLGAGRDPNYEALGFAFKDVSTRSLPGCDALVSGYDAPTVGDRPGYNAPGSAYTVPAGGHDPSNESLAPPYRMIPASDPASPFHVDNAGAASGGQPASLASASSSLPAPQPGRALYTWWPPAYDKSPSPS